MLNNKDEQNDDIFSELASEPSGFHDGDSSNDENTDDSNDDGDEGKDANGEGGTGDDAGAKFREALQSRLEKRFGAEVKVPETVTPETVEDFILGLSENSLHPEVRRFQKALAEGKKPAEYLTEYTAIDRHLAMSDTELVANSYRQRFGKNDQRKDGWDEDKIARHVKSLESRPEDLELEAERIREGLRQEKQKREKELESYSPQSQVDYNDPEFVKRFESGVSKAMDAVVKEMDGDFFGIDLSKAESTQKLAKHAMSLLRPDPKTRISAFDSVLSDNNKLLKMALLYDMAERGHLRAYISKEKERAKSDFIKGLDLQPAVHKGTAKGKTSVNLDAAARPAGFA